jgi:glycosyltransferase involved in cell wall biosynthesis
MHHVYAKKGINDGRWFDAVIPNYFDPDDFPYLNTSKNREYLLFLGRLVQRKGPHIASEIARASGMQLIVAGAGGKQVGTDIVAPEVTIKDAHYVGPVNAEERAKLLAGARALLVPTTYIEPFGGVAVEAMMAGTPVITSDWGAFTEIVLPKVVGYRFHTLAEAVEAINNVGICDPQLIQDYAHRRYSLEAVAPQFKLWFDRLNSLWDKGWYQL